jgi:hypothetical protein
LSRKGKNGRHVLGCVTLCASVKERKRERERDGVSADEKKKERASGEERKREGEKGRLIDG